MRPRRCPLLCFWQADRRYSGFTCYAALAPHRASNIEDVSYQILLGEKKYFVSTDGGGERQQWFAPMLRIILFIT